MSGIGTIDDPFDLETVADGEYVKPGHTVWLRGGIYKGDFDCAITGESDNPVTIRPYNDEVPIIAGSLTASGDNVIWRDLAKTISSGARWTDETGSAPAIAAGVFTLRGKASLLYPLVYDQADNGIAWWANANGGLVYGAWIMNNGWGAPDRGHGHGFYTQNLDSSDVKTIKHCFVGPQYGMGSSNLALYGTRNAALRNYRITESVFIGGRQLIGGDSPVDNVIVDGCHVWGRLLLGWHDAGHVNVIVRNSILYNSWGESIMPHYMRNFTLENCRIVTEAGKLVYLAEPATGLGTYTGTGNDYYNAGADVTPFQVETVAHLDFAQWQSRYNIDADSAYTTGLPARGEHYLYADDYEPDRAYLVIWNWTDGDTYSVDVSALFGAGDVLRLHSALDYLDDHDDYTVAGDGTIAVDMRAASHPVRMPRNHYEATPLMDTTFPRMGAFAVIRQ